MALLKLDNIVHRFDAIRMCVGIFCTNLESGLSVTRTFQCLWWKDERSQGREQGRGHQSAFSQQFCRKFNGKCREPTLWLIFSRVSFYLVPSLTQFRIKYRVKLSYFEWKILFLRRCQQLTLKNVTNTRYTNYNSVV